jgi:hypothetical protein
MHTRYTFMYKFIITISATLLFASCGLEPKDNTANNKKMEDTLFKVLPTVNRLTVEVKDNKEVIVTLGDAELYSDSDEKRKQVTEQVAAITKSIYMPDNDLKEGSVVFVKEETTTEVKDPKTYPMALQ